MQGNPKIIDYFNRGIRAELASFNEYWLESRLLSNWGFKKLAHDLWRDYKKQHAKTAQCFIDCVIYMEGAPSMVPNPFVPGAAVDGVLASALAAENAMRMLYAEATAAAESAGDWTSEEMFQRAVMMGERRIVKLETQIELIATIGLELYSQKKI